MSDTGTDPIDLSKPIDFSDIDSGGGALPEGTYPVRVAKVKEAVSQAGNNVLKLEFEVVGGPFSRRRIFYNQTLIKKCAWSFRDMLVAMGINVDSPVTVGQAKRLIGKTLKVKTGIDKVNNKEYTSIVQFLPPSDKEEDTDTDSTEDDGVLF